MGINRNFPNKCQDYVTLDNVHPTSTEKKKPPISRRFRMCSVTVLLAPPLGLEPRTL